MNSTLLNNERVNDEIQEDIEIYLETNEKENTVTQNLWDMGKTVLRGKLIAIQKQYLK